MKQRKLCQLNSNRNHNTLSRPGFSMMNRVWGALSLAIVLNPLLCQPAYADAALPMLFIVWPYSCLLSLLIIPFEAFLAVRILKLKNVESLKLAGITNLVSTIVGIPITWLILLLVQTIIGGGTPWGSSWTTRPPFGIRILSIVVQSAWLIPNYLEWAWILPTAVIFLCVPFFFMSVWIEFIIAQRFLGELADKKLLLKWSWIANAWSYGLIIAVLLLIAVYGASHPPHLKSID